MNSRIKGGGDQIPGKLSPSCHETILQKPAPEDFLSRSGNEEQKEEDESLIRPHSQRINPPYLGVRPGKNMGCKVVAQKKNEIKEGCRKKSEQERAEMEGYFWSLPE